MMPNAQARERSVNNLQQLYTVVVSLAITEGLAIVLKPYVTPTPGAAVDNSVQSWLMLCSLLVTLIPFYHGANRYLDATYVTGEREAKHWALLVDFIALFIEGFLLFVLASFIGHSKPFFLVLGGLLLFDATWVWITRYEVKDGQPKDAKFNVWLVTNIVSAILVGVFAFTAIATAEWRGIPIAELLLLSVAAGRTIYDYWSVWDFYYPVQLHAPRPAPLVSDRPVNGG
ncbi:MAG: hypothetical protein ABFE08_00990 [Armatimonadia bacterium]